MHKLKATAYKEFLLIIRDIGSVAILFIMPLVLIITITLIQDSTFKTVEDTKIPVLVVDNDQGEVSETILDGLQKSNALEIHRKKSEKEAKELVFDGEYQLVIVIPEHLTDGLNIQVHRNVENMLDKFGFGDRTDTVPPTKAKKQEVRLYFDPATQASFKSSVKNGIEKMMSKIETETVYSVFQQQLTDDPDEVLFETDSYITFKEVSQQKGDKEYRPTSVQHNVPAWSLFAIFFIIVPLSINIVKEKSQGTFVRLRTNPVAYAVVLGGKTLVYLIVCLIQFGLMLLVGVYVFPQLGLPALDVSGKLPLLFIVSIFAGLAAIGLGLLLGTIAKTQEQSAPFGATFVVILAAIGGVWVPVFMMPKIMQNLSHISPMNWGLNAFYDVFLRNASFWDILPEILLLLLFFIVTTLISIIYDERKNAV